MKLLRTLSVLLPTACLLPLIGCQDTPRSIVSQETALAGGVSFQLDTATVRSVRGMADSLRLELRKGTALRSVTVLLDQTIRVTDLEPGEWTLEAALYNAAGTISWYAKGTVVVAPGGTAKAELTLKPAKGAVDVIIRLDSSGLSRSDSLLRGEWFFETAYGKPIRVGSARPYIGLGVDGFSFYDGCNHSAGGSWTVNASSLSLKAGPTTLMACLDSTGAWATDMNVNRAVGATAFWAIDSEKRLILRGADSAVVATLARTPSVQPPEEPVIVPPSPIDTIPVIEFPPVRPIIDPMPEPVLPACPTDSGLVLPAKDTALMAGLKLDTALVQIVSRCDSGVWLDVTLPNAGSTPIVFGYEAWLARPFSRPSCCGSVHSLPRG